MRRWRDFPARYEMMRLYGQYHKLDLRLLDAETARRDLTTDIY
jgi:hypothetical protein